MEHFDESEIREIGIDDRNYPELLRKIEKPPRVFCIRGSLPPNRKIIAISGSRETTQQALDAAYRIGRMLVQHGYTIVDGLARGCDPAATEGALSVGGKVIGVVPRGLKSLQGHKKNLLNKSLLREGQSFLNILTTS
ncbi:MAG: DNA-processing protein DprA [Candidatus Poribacteria bacterium]|nr:DNA-processing protein DprA [Candidatus Poribacteria bacterium]